MTSLVSARVILIEDEAHVALLIEAMLSDLDFELVGSATRVSTGLALLVGTDFDVAVLDVNLAGEMSFPLANELAARGKPFIFVTGYGPSGLPPEHRGAPVVTKPFRAADLLSALQTALDPVPLGQ